MHDMSEILKKIDDIQAQLEDVNELLKAAQSNA